MKKQHQRRQHRHPARGPSHTERPAATSSFTPVSVRARHDGWTPARQVAFVNALAATATVEDACAAVGMSPRSYYDLRARPDAGSFRQAVDAAIDVGVHRVADAMLGRALHGEVTPIFYKGEQVGERRKFDNRLGMFILRVRAPERYGKWRDAMQQHREHPDGAAIVLQQAIRHLAEDGAADAAGKPRTQRPPVKMMRLMDDPVEIAAQEYREAERQRQQDRAEQARADAEFDTYLDTLQQQTGGGRPEPDSSDDVPRGS